MQKKAREYKNTKNTNPFSEKYISSKCANVLQNLRNCNNDKLNADFLQAIAAGNHQKASSSLTATWLGLVRPLLYNVINVVLHGHGHIRKHISN